MSDSIQISIGKPALAGHYKLIDPSQGVSLDSINDISPASCHEILADQILDYIPIGQLDSLLSTLVSKLRHGGRLILGGTEVYELCYLYWNGNTTTEEFNKLVFGEQRHAWEYKRALYSLNEIVNKLLELSLEIQEKRFEHDTFVIIAKRK